MLISRKNAMHIALNLMSISPLSNLNLDPVRWQSGVAFSAAPPLHPTTAYFSHFKQVATIVADSPKILLRSAFTECRMRLK